jgi:sugar lactone lactonase YvrE
VNGITAGPDGALWFTECCGSAGAASAIGRISTTGVITEFKLQSGIIPSSIITGPDGALWFVDSGTTGNRAVGRITTAGDVTEYPVPNLATALNGGFNIAAGPDGSLWFGDGNNSIGHMTTTGVLTEYAAGALVSGVTKGPDGAMWFTIATPGQLGRITMNGVVTLYDVPGKSGGPITLGPDNALWYYKQADDNKIARVQVPARTGVLSHIAAGGGWNSTVSLVNMSSASVPARLAFYADDGSALSLPLTVTQQGRAQSVTGSTLDRVIGPNTTLLVDTGNQLASTVVGWADVTSVGPLGGFAIFRQTPQTGSPSEGTVPLQSQFPSTVTLAYDNMAGFVMGVALANLSTSSATITATMWDDSGNLLGTQIITIAGSGHTAFVLPTQLALTAGKRGIVKFQSAASGGLTGLGLRFSPFGTFTSVPTM